MKKYTIMYVDGELDGQEIEISDARKLQVYDFNFTGYQYVLRQDTVAVVKSNVLLEDWISYTLERYTKVGKNLNNIWVYKFEQLCEIVRCKAINKTNSKRCKKSTKENCEFCPTHERLKSAPLDLCK